MKNNHQLTLFAVALSFIFAFCVMIIPMSQTLKWFRPDLVSLVLIYWTINLPNNVGVLTALVVGLLFDLMTGMLFGSMALTLGVVAYFAINLRLRFRLYRYWQKFIIIILLVACSQMIRLWIQMFIGQPPVSFMYWFSSLTSALIWPVVYIVLHSYQRTLKLS